MKSLDLQQSFSIMMEQHTERLLRIAYYYTKNIQTAEDIVQDVFIKFFDHQHLYQEQGELYAYLTRCTVNRSKDYLKSWYARKILFQQSLRIPVATHAKDLFVLQDEQAIISEAIMGLSLKHREVLVYYYFEDMTITEISRLLHIPESTVKTRMRRAKELLHTQLKDIEWEVLLHE